jgi:hypothetical protein
VVDRHAGSLLACLDGADLSGRGRGDRVSRPRQTSIDVGFLYKQTGDAQAKAADSWPILQALLTK